MNASLLFCSRGWSEFDGEALRLLVLEPWINLSELHN